MLYYFYINKEHEIYADDIQLTELQAYKTIILRFNTP